MILAPMDICLPAGPTRIGVGGKVGSDVLWGNELLVSVAQCILQQFVILRGELPGHL